MDTIDPKVIRITNKLMDSFRKDMHSRLKTILPRSSHNTREEIIILMYLCSIESVIRGIKEGKKTTIKRVTT